MQKKKVCCTYRARLFVSLFAFSLIDLLIYFDVLVAVAVWHYTFGLFFFKQIISILMRVSLLALANSVYYLVS